MGPSLVMCHFRKAVRQFKSRKFWKHEAQLFDEHNRES